MRIETKNAIYEDTDNKLIPLYGKAYGCECGEPTISNMKMNYKVKLPSYEYSFTCCCGNKIKVFVKDIHAKDEV